MERAAPLRIPLGVGEIVSDALATLRQHFRVFIVVALPFAALDLLLREAGGSAMDAARTALGSDPSKLGVPQFGAALGGFGIGIACYFGSFTVIQLLASANVLLAERAWSRAPLVLGAAMAGALRRAPALILTGFLFFLVLMAVLVPGAVPPVVGILLDSTLAIWAGAVLAIIYAVAVFVVVTLRLGLYTQVCVLEKQHTLGAFSRSSELVAARGEKLVNGPKWRLSLVFLVALALSAALQALFALPRFLMASAIGWSVADAGLPPLTALPLWFGVPFALVEVATNAVVFPFSSVLLTLFYFDLRVRYEAVDIEAPKAT